MEENAMKKKLFIPLSLVLSFTVLNACSDDDEVEVKMLDVDFDVPDTAEVNEEVELTADVTYGDEPVEEVEDMSIEYWEKGDRDNSERIEPESNGDGSYTAKISFDHDGVFEMFAHTDAEGLHTMPKESITIGEGAD